MSRLVVPLQHRRLLSTGDIVFWADLILKTNRGAWKQIPFRVDSGTEMTTMAAFEAGALDLQMPKNPVPHLTLHGQEVRSGFLRARIFGMDPTEFVFPCYCLGDPKVQPRTQARNLLGLTGVISQIRLTFDGRPSAHAVHGVLVVEN